MLIDEEVKETCNSSYEEVISQKWSTPIKIIYKNIKNNCNSNQLKITFGIKLNQKSRTHFSDIKECKEVLVASLKNLLIDFSNFKLLLK